MSNLPTTPSQTVGPYLHIGLNWDDGPYTVPLGTPGAVWIRGRVFDGAGEPLDDAMVEIWQADTDGHIAHPDDGRGVAEYFRGFARSDTRTGGFAVYTVVPGALGDGQAPHIDVSVFGRGLLHRVVTRIYFPEHADQHATDPVLAVVPPERRGSLIAADSPDGYVFDVYLQGERETVFFDV